MFKELGLKESSLKAIARLGFEKPSEIQEKSIPILLAGDIDFVGQAQTGTGKTAAFVLPLLEKINTRLDHIQALIIAPTRELANQIQVQIDELSHFDKVKSVCVYGGVSIMMQIKDIKRDKPQIIVGTPGRLIDLIDRGVLKLEQVSHVVLDEADEMLDMGFFEDVQTIVATVENKKLWMFSATMPKPIMNLVNNHFNNPQMVSIKKQHLTNDSVSQQYILVQDRDRAEALSRLLDFEQDIYAIVFCRTKMTTQQLADELNSRGFSADCLHGDMSQDQRDLTMNKFKLKKTKLLICTDVAARGIDVNDLTHVINFGLPQDNESYVHRIGRTGRAGKKGVALSIIDKKELSRMSQIERITKAKIEKVNLPKVEEIKAALLDKAFEKFSTAFTMEMTSPSFNQFMSKFEATDKNDLLKAVYYFMFEQAQSRYDNAREIEFIQSARGPAARVGNDRDRGNSRGGNQRFFISIGSEDGVQTGDMVRFLASELGMPGRQIGRIDIKDKFSFVELPDQFTDRALELSGMIFNERKVNVELSQSKGSAPRSRSPRMGGASRGPRGYTSGSRAENGAGGASRAPARFKKKPTSQSLHH